MQKKSKNLRINVNGNLPKGVTAKDVILKIIGTIGTAGGTGYVVEFAGDVIKSLSMEERMTVCNMTIEAGARAGLIAPDEKTFSYLKGKTMSPKGENWNKALEFWRTLYSDKDCKFDKEINIDGKNIEPLVTWGTSPQDVSPVTGIVPDPENEKNEDRKMAMKRSLEYMGLKANTKISDIKIDKIFIGSCTNGRIEDLRLAADLLKGKRIADNVSAMVVPGSGLVKEQAEKEGLDKIFKNAGLKFFFVANLKKRAERRYYQLKNQGISANLPDLEDKLSIRDMNDTTRSLSPLVKPKGAIEIDTSDLTITRVFDIVMNEFEKSNII